MEPINIFKNTVVIFVLTTIIFIFLVNKNNLHFPTLEEQLRKESKHHFLIALVISLVLVVSMILLRNKK